MALREPGYLDNPLRQNLWRAGRAHAGVLVILTLVGLLLVDQADLSNGLKWLVGYALVAGPILLPLGLPVGGLSLSVGVRIFGLGLLSA